MLDSWNRIVDRPTSHPHYNQYRDQCIASEMNIQFIETSWKYIIRGLNEIYLDKKYGVPSIGVYFLLLQDLIKSQNQKVMLPKRHTANSKFALWSGGIAVSEYARSSGYFTLENTLLGGILNELSQENKIWIIEKKWGPQGKLWNALSTIFIEEISGLHNELHVFLRTHDLKSVLFREEIRRWNEIKSTSPPKKNGLIFHVLVGLESFKQEKIFNNERDALSYLISIHKKIHRDYFTNMLSQKHGNYRHNSMVWSDNQQAYDGTFHDPLKEASSSYQDILHSSSEKYLEDYAQMQRSIQPTGFSTELFAQAMLELKQKTKKIDVTARSHKEIALAVEKLNGMHMLLDKNPSCLATYKEIDILYARAMRDFKTEDELRAIVYKFRHSIPESQERRLLAKKLFKRSSSMIRRIRGLAYEIPVNHSPPRSEVIEQRAPYIAPIVGRPYYKSPKNHNLSYPDWVKNYTRVNSHSAYSNMTEQEKRLLEKIIIAGKVVQYLPQERLAELRVKLKDGLLYDFNGQLFDTSQYNTRAHGQGFGTVVMVRGALIYSYMHESKILHHTTLSAGKAVIFAGEWKVCNGKVSILTNKTGHYRTPNTYLDDFREFLIAAHINLEQTEIRYMA